MNTAHQPGSEPVQIPEQIPNPAVRPPAPEPNPGRRAPVELPRHAGSGMVVAIGEST